MVDKYYALRAQQKIVAGRQQLHTKRKRIMAARRQIQLSCIDTGDVEALFPERHR